MDVSLPFTLLEIINLIFLKFRFACRKFLHFWQLRWKDFQNPDQSHGSCCCSIANFGNLRLSLCGLPNSTENRTDSDCPRFVGLLSRLKLHLIIRIISYKTVDNIIPEYTYFLANPFENHSYKQIPNPINPHISTFSNFPRIILISLLKPVLPFDRHREIIKMLKSLRAKSFLLLAKWSFPESTPDIIFVYLTSSCLIFCRLSSYRFRI